MHKRLPIFGRLTGRMWDPKLLAGVLVAGLSMTASVWAQEMGSSWSASSVDESFSEFHQALSARANDLLAGAQRPSTPPQLGPDLPATSQLPSAFDFAAASQTEENIRLQQAAARVQALRPTIEPILREEGVPPQVAAVVVVESGGRPTALSSKGARGLWQIMPDTARRYGLIVSDRVDERLNPYKSTRAAARYLRDLYRQFGNWPLALAAYNAGEEAVERAILRASSRDFNSLARADLLPLETQNYLPAVLSAVAMMETTAGAHFTTGAGKSVINTVVYAMDQIGKLGAYE